MEYLHACDEQNYHHDTIHTGGRYLFRPYAIPHLTGGLTGAGMADDGAGGWATNTSNRGVCRRFLSALDCPLR
jgi:hypothetical protein